METTGAAVARSLSALQRRGGSEPTKGYGSSRPRLFRRICLPRRATCGHAGLLPPSLTITRFRQPAASTAQPDDRWPMSAAAAAAPVALGPGAARLQSHGEAPQAHRFRSARTHGQWPSSASPPSPPARRTPAGRPDGPALPASASWDRTVTSMPVRWSSS
jgi:hypothetical protein